MPERMALGATYVGTLHTNDIVSVTAVADPEIVDVERIDSTRVRIVGVGVGETTVTFTDGERSKVFPIEVAPPDEFDGGM